MVERRISALLAALAVLLVCAMLWDAFGGVRARRPVPRALSAVDTASASHRPRPLSETTAVQGARVPAPLPPPPPPPRPRLPAAHQPAPHAAAHAPTHGPTRPSTRANDTKQTQATNAPPR